MSDPKSHTPNQGGKKKKGKGKTVALHEFLADTKVGGSVVEPVKRTTSWADATEEIDPVDISTVWEDDQHREKREVFDYSKLPTAPRSVRQADIDMTRLPKHPPYTLFLGNLSYEVNEEDLSRFFEERKVMVSRIRLPTDSGTSRLKGFGYAEFKDVQNLLAALHLNFEMVNNRPIRIDLANASDGGDDESRGYSKKPSYSEERSDWRRPSDEDRSWRGSSPRDNYDRGSPPRRGYNDRPYDRGGKRQPTGRGRRDYDSPPRGGRDRYDGRDRDDRYGDRPGDDRWQHDKYDDYSGGRHGRGHSPRGGRRFDDRDRRRDWGRRDDRDLPPRDRESERDLPKERPKLQLIPRSKPVDTETQLSPGSQTSIFGGAKPVDTASKEQIIEEKLRRMEEKEKRLAEEKRLLEKQEMERQEAFRKEKEKERPSGIDDDWRKSRDKTDDKRSGDSGRGNYGDRGSYGDRGNRHPDSRGRKWSDEDQSDRHGDRRDRDERRGGRRGDRGDRHGDHRGGRRGDRDDHRGDRRRDRDDRWEEKDDRHGDKRGERRKDKQVDHHGDKRKDHSDSINHDTSNSKVEPRMDEDLPKGSSSQEVKKSVERFEDEGPTFVQQSRYALLNNSESEDKDSNPSEEEN